MPEEKIKRRRGKKLLTKDELKEKNAKLRAEARAEKKRQRERERYKRLKKQKEWDLANQLRTIRKKDLSKPLEEIQTAVHIPKFMKEEIDIVVSYQKSTIKNFMNIAIAKELKRARIALNLEEDDKPDIIQELELKIKELEITLERLNMMYEKKVKESDMWRKFYEGKKK